jgi:hypothetical protein
MSDSINQSSFFTTSDLFLATTLTLFYPIDGIDKMNPRKAIFLFKREKRLDELLSRYWNHELTVEPQALLNQLKAIKTRLYET